jgi:hypothetical protein
MSIYIPPATDVSVTIIEMEDYVNEQLNKNLANYLQSSGGTITGNLDVNGYIEEDTLTPSTVIVSNSSKKLVSSAVTATTLGYLDATSSVQTQLNGKQSTFTLNDSIVPVTNGSGALTSSTVTATTLGYLDATSSVQTQLNAKQATITLNNSIVPVTNGSGALTSSTVTATTLGYLDATSSVQTQLNAKQSTITLNNSIVPVTNGSGALTSSSTTSTELGYVHGVTSAIQTQINAIPVLTGIANSTGNIVMSAPVVYVQNEIILEGEAVLQGTTVLEGILSFSPSANGSILNIYNAASTNLLNLTSTTSGGSLTLNVPTSATNITLSDVANGTPGSHYASVAVPSSNNWTIPFDPNNPTNPINATTIKPPKGVKIVFKNVLLTSGTSSTLGIRLSNGGFVTGGYQYQTNTYATTGSTSGIGSNQAGVSNQYMFVDTVTYNASVGISGYINVNWDLGSTTHSCVTYQGQLYYYSGSNFTALNLNGVYVDSASNIGSCYQIELTLTAGGSPAFAGGTTNGSCHVIMDRS